MAESGAMGRDELLRQVRQHVESLRLAGVEWLPDGSPPDTLPALSARERGAGEVAATRHEDAEAAIEPPSEPRSTNLFEAPAPAAAEQRPIEERRQALRVLAERVAVCTRCPELVATRTQTVFGVGEPGVELCFVGEAPGADEDAQGEPFVGAAGQLLNRIILACRMKREEVYICNILKCRPPGNRTPLPNEIACCREYLEEQLSLVRPRFICALGSVAAQNLLGTTQSLGRLRGRFHDYRGIPVMVTYHPAYLLPHRNPEKKKDVWEDMKWLMARMGRPVA